jgi:hypothetical protein
MSEETLDNMKISGGLARFLRMWYQPNNLLESWVKFMVEAHFADWDRARGFESTVKFWFQTHTHAWLRNEYKPLISVLTVVRRLREAGSKDLDIWKLKFAKGFAGESSELTFLPSRPVIDDQRQTEELSPSNQWSNRICLIVA